MSLGIALNSCLDPRVALDMKHEDIFIGFGFQYTHLLLAPLSLRLMLHCAQLVLGCVGCFIAGVFVVGSDQEG